MKKLTAIAVAAIAILISAPQTEAQFHRGFGVPVCRVAPVNSFHRGGFIHDFHGGFNRGGGVYDRGGRGCGW